MPLIYLFLYCRHILFSLLRNTIRWYLISVILAHPSMAFIWFSPHFSIHYIYFTASVISALRVYKITQFIHIHYSLLATHYICSCLIPPTFSLMIKALSAFDFSTIFYYTMLFLYNIFASFHFSLIFSYIAYCWSIKAISACHFGASLASTTHCLLSPPPRLYRLRTKQCTGLAATRHQVLSLQVFEDYYINIWRAGFLYFLISE